jgi:high-affinity iron transporter
MGTESLPTFAVTLREGVEVVLVFGIVLAALRRGDRPELRPWAWGGLFLGALASIGLGLLLQQWFAIVTHSAAKQWLETGIGIGAIALLSWMLLWMTSQSRGLKGQIEGDVARQRAGWGILALVLVSVLREGFEVVLFLGAQVSTGTAPLLGAVAGLATAGLIGVALFQWGVRLDLRQFFQAMGVLLLLILGGLVVGVLGHLERAVCPVAPGPASSCLLGSLLWDWHRTLSDRTFPGVVLKAVLGYRDRLFWGQLLGYLGFLGGAGWLYWRRLRS